MPSVLMPASISRSRQHESRGVNPAELLRKEFSTPFAIVDAIDSTVISVPDDFPCELTDPRCVQFVQRAVTSGQATVWQAPGRLLLLAVPVWTDGTVSVVAIGAFLRWDAPNADQSPVGWVESAKTHHPKTYDEPNTDQSGTKWSSLASCPPQCLERWANSVASSLRLRDRLRSNTKRCEALERQIEAGEKTLPVLDRLVGRLSISDNPERFQKLAFSILSGAVSADCLAWVGANPREPAVVIGHCPVDTNQLRRLVSEVASDRCSPAHRSFIENDVQATTWGASFDGVRSVLVVTPCDEKPGGWLVGINKCSESGFTRNDAGLMQVVASFFGVSRKNANVYMDLKELLFGVVRALASAIDAKDGYTRGHSERVARIAVVLGRHMKLSPDELSNLYLAGLLHDVGKIGVEDNVLKKTDKLTDDEYRHVMSHVEIGTAILRELKRLRHILPGVRHHHERFDGRGYPDKLEGENIPLIGRILAVADSFDAMSADRSYRRRRSETEVQDILSRGAGSQWDPQVVQAALACWPELNAIQQRGLGESLRVAVDDALHQDYPTPKSSLKVER